MPSLSSGVVDVQLTVIKRPFFSPLDSSDHTMLLILFFFFQLGMLSVIAKRLPRTTQLKIACRRVVHSTTTCSAKWKDVEVPIGEEKWIDVPNEKEVEEAPKSMTASPVPLTSFRCK